MTHLPGLMSPPLLYISTLMTRLSISMSQPLSPWIPSSTAPRAPYNPHSPHQLMISPSIWPDLKTTGLLPILATNGSTIILLTTEGIFEIHILGPSPRDTTIHRVHFTFVIALVALASLSCLSGPTFQAPAPTSVRDYLDILDAYVSLFSRTRVLSPRQYVPALSGFMPYLAPSRSARRSSERLLTYSVLRSLTNIVATATGSVLTTIAPQAFDRVPTHFLSIHCLHHGHPTGSINELESYIKCTFAYNVTSSLLHQTRRQSLPCDPSLRPSDPALFRIQTLPSEIKCSILIHLLPLLSRNIQHHSQHPIVTAPQGQHETVVNVLPTYYMAQKIRSISSIQATQLYLCFPFYLSTTFHGQCSSPASLNHRLQRSNSFPYVLNPCRYVFLGISQFPNNETGLSADSHCVRTCYTRSFPMLGLANPASPITHKISAITADPFIIVPKNFEL